MDRPGNAEIQLALLYDYRTNLPLYPEFQAFFRKYQPLTLIVWGKNDTVFPAEGALPYKRDLPNAEIHLIDTGHFALEREFDDEGLMYARHASINDLPITEVDRKFRWPLGKRTDGHPGLSDLGL